jgi:hypothetical protein
MSWKSTSKKRISLLKKRLKPAEKKLFEIAKIVARTNEYRNEFWAKLRKQVREAYQEANIVFNKWSLRNLPESYDQNSRIQVQKINKTVLKKIQAFKATIQAQKPVNAKDFNNSLPSKRTKKKITTDAIDDYSDGLARGEKNYNKWMLLKQENNKIEATLSEAFKEAFEEMPSVGEARKRLEQELSNIALDKHYITIINKNGKPINYTIRYYAEMVARTKMIEMQSKGTQNLSRAYDSNLVQVSSHNTQTAYDAQFEGKIYSLDGKDKDFPEASDLPPFHPNCLHVLTVFFKEAQPEKRLEELSKFSKGEIDQPPNKPSFIPVKDRKDLK